MRTLLAAIALAVSAAAWATSDNITPTITERSHVSICNGEPETCWPTARNSVPEPDTLWLLALAGGAVWIIKRKRK